MSADSRAGVPITGAPAGGDESNALRGMNASSRARKASARPLRVAYILWDGALGGAASNAISLATHAPRDELELTLCLLQHPGVASARAHQHGARVIHFGARSGLDFRAAWRFTSFLRRERFDIVHNNSKTWFAHAAVWLASTRLARVYQEHGDIHTLGSERSAGVLYRLFPALYGRYLTVSSETASAMLRAGAPAERIVNVHNPIDLKSFASPVSSVSAREQLGLPQSGVIVGTACRLVQSKDLPLFLDTAYRIRNAMPGCLFVIAGEGAEEPQLRFKAATLGLTSSVRFLGNCGDMPCFWRAIDVFLLTSHRESFGLTILESLAAGTPIVGVRPAMGGGALIGAARGVALIDTRSADDLARAALSLLANEALRLQLGDEGYRWVSAQKQFHVERWTERILAEYYDLARAPSALARATCRH